MKTGKKFLAAVALCGALTSANASTSLIDERPELFRSSKYLMLETTGDPAGVHARCFNPDCSYILDMKVKKNAITKQGEWNFDDFRILRKEKCIYSAGLKMETKYKGYRENLLGKIGEKILFLEQEYKGTFLADEYISYPLWNITLQNHDEFTKWLSYVITALETKGIDEVNQKPVLLLSLENDMALSSLTEDDYEILESLFEFVHPEDLKTAKYIAKIQGDLNTTLMSYHAAHPHHLTEPVRQRLFKKVESFFEKFDVTDMTSKFLYLTATVIVLDVIKDLIKYDMKHQVKSYFMTESTDEHPSVLKDSVKNIAYKTLYASAGALALGFVTNIIQEKLKKAKAKPVYAMIDIPTEETTVE